MQGKRRRKVGAGSVLEGQPITFPITDANAEWDVRQSEKLFSSLKSRWELTRIVRPRGVGVELGVADGIFSEVLLRKSNLDYLYSIDMYGDRKHTVEQYKTTLVRLAPYRSRNCILKLRFDEALPLFPDNYFDFIYIDGYAAGGQEAGNTLYDWLPKLKRGGVFAGHDYCADWPLVVKAVDQFAADNKLRIVTVGGVSEPEDTANRYTSWFAVPA